MQVPSTKVTALGEISLWGRQFLQLIQGSNLAEITFDSEVSSFCQRATDDDKVHSVFIENQPESRNWIFTLRKTKIRTYILWYGRSFSKEDYKFALENRIYAVLENPKQDDKSIIEWLSKLKNNRENASSLDSLINSVKGIVVQADPDNISSESISELKIAISKLEHAARKNEFLENLSSKELEQEDKLPFTKTADIESAFTTVADLNRTGTLYIRGSLPNQECSIEFLQGKIVSAFNGEVTGLKAVWRAFLWDSPRFLFSRSESKDIQLDTSLNVSLQYICEMGKNQKDRFEVIRKANPPADLCLELEPSMLHKATILPAEDFSALASVVEAGRVQDVLDQNESADVDLLESLIRLRKHNVIRISGGA